MSDDLVTDPTPRQVRVWNIANGLTLLRLFLVPLFVGLLFAGDGHTTSLRIWAGVVFALAALTDLFDGDIARRRGIVTDVGKIADPIADKALTGAAFIGLSALGEIPWWVTVVVIAREVAVTALRFVVLRYGVIPASRGGKAKTILQLLALWLYILPLGAVWQIAAGCVLAAAVVVTVVTGLDYLVRAWRLRQSVLARRGVVEPVKSVTL